MVAGPFSFCPTAMSDPLLHGEITHEIIGEFRADLVVERKVIVELKACERIVAAHEAQLISYLRSSKLELGLLLNFGPKPERRRIIWTDDMRALRDR